jgi:hypothetical protein
MPVLTKIRHKKLMEELDSRYNHLRRVVEARELSSSREGCPKGRGWANPERLCSTHGTEMDLRLAVEDFKAILMEVKALKS